MNDSVKLSIISGFDPKGVNDAKAGMTSAAAAARAQSAATRGAADAQTSASDTSASMTKNMRGAAAGTAALSAALGQGTGGLAATARGAGAAFGALAAGPLALLITGIAALAGAWAVAKQRQKEATDAQDAQVKKIQATRLDNLVNEYHRVREAIQGGYKISEAFNASILRLSDARSKTAETRYGAEAMTRESAATSPEAKQRVRLDEGYKAAERAAATAREAATEAENIAFKKLALAREEAAAAADNLANLRAEYETSSEKKKIAAEIMSAQKEVRETSAAIKTAENDALAASEGIVTAMETGRVETTLAAQRISDFERALELSHAAAMEISANEAEMAGLTADQSSLQRAVNAALQRKQAALDKADAAGAVPLGKWVANQKAMNDGKKAASEDEADFRDNVQKIKDKQGRGIRISRADQETLDLIAQRGRITAAAEAAGAKKSPEAVLLAEVVSQLSELKDINANLKGNLKAN